MNGNMKIDPLRLGRDAVQMEGCIRTMKREIQEMKRSASEVDRMWDGPGSEAFKKIFWEDLRDMEEALGVLGKICRHQAEAARQYEACERKVCTLAVGIDI